MRAVVISCLLLGACTPSHTRSSTPPRITDSSQERVALEGKTVAVFPVTVVGEYGDQRAGMLFNDVSRIEATDYACDVLAGQIKIDVKCVDEQAVARSAILTDLQSRYALGLNMSRNSLRGVAKAVEAQYALLFRPDDVTSAPVPAQRSSRESRRPLSDLSVERLMKPVPPQKAPRKADARKVIVSAVLLDLQRGALLRQGRTERRNPGYDGTPEAVLLLKDILVELGEAMLADSGM